MQVGERGQKEVCSGAVFGDVLPIQHNNSTLAILLLSPLRLSLPCLEVRDKNRQYEK